MNPDQTTPWEQSGRGAYYLQYRLSRTSRRQKLGLAGKGYTKLMITYETQTHSLCL